MLVLVRAFRRFRQQRLEQNQCDLFDALKASDTFDLIIGNLPVSDFPAAGIVESALYDPDFDIHRRFFKQAGKHTRHGGAIIMTHIDFYGAGDFDRFEKMVNDFGFKVQRFIEIEHIGYRWRMYRIIKAV